MPLFKLSMKFMEFKNFIIFSFLKQFNRQNYVVLNGFVAFLNDRKKRAVYKYLMLKLFNEFLQISFIHAAGLNVRLRFLKTARARSSLSRPSARRTKWAFDSLAPEASSSLMKCSNSFVIGTVIVVIYYIIVLHYIIVNVL